ncbi:hypothetical protein, partial [Streptomyces sp. NPDC059468]|uniref:hypothetical protein n=1 Tax=Streptomyces sp. NPDC059468 TaxID=3346845 RepID=UPI0036BF9EFF
VLVGGSSTGKTRALWEAVRKLPEGWRLWHPLSPSRPGAALADLADIAPNTVVWLNEAQYYLGPDLLGEQVAAGLRDLLRDPSRAPVLVLATLWPEHWATLTTDTGSDRHAHARELLDGHKIDVPDAFSPADLTALDATGTDADPRLAQAADRARDGQVTQYLAGVPVLRDRYGAARGATRALIHAAMDARRLGAGPHIPLDWLADATPGYLTDTEYNTLDNDWLPKALAYVTTPCHGIPGILTPVKTGSPRNQRNRRPPTTSGPPNGRSTHSPQGPHYQLADSLEQHGRYHRSETIPPIDFWTAAAHHAHPTDLEALGDAAERRGLYRDAAQLHKLATSHSDHAAAELVDRLHALHPTDHRPARWAATHAPLNDPVGVGLIVGLLQRAGAHEQVDALLARDPAAHVSLHDPQSVVWLVDALHGAGARAQAEALAARAAADAPLDTPNAVVMLLERLREAGAHEQVDALLARDPGAHVSLDDPVGVGWILGMLQRAGAHEQADDLAARAAAHAPLHDPDTVGRLLERLREAGAHEQVDALLARNPAAHVSLDDLEAVAGLCQALREARAYEQFDALALRAATHAPLYGMLPVAWMRDVLQRAEAHEQFDALAARTAASVALDDPCTMDEALDWLWELGANEQVDALLARDPAAHVSLDGPEAVAGLVERLRVVGAREQADALAARATAHVSLDDPEAVAGLLEGLREAGANEQVDALLARDPAARVSLDKSGAAVDGLLERLWEVGAHEQADALIERLPAAGLFRQFIRVTSNPKKFRLGREPDGGVSPSWTWDDLD